MFSILPRSGLANRLFVWARGQLCADAIGVPNRVHGWGHFHLGPWLRRERSKRFYATSFRRTSSHGQLAFDRFMSSMGRRAFEVNPNNILPHKPDGETTYIFQETLHRNDYFAGLRGHAEHLRERLLSLMVDSVRQECLGVPESDVSVHLRRGDFHYYGGGITGDEYFLDVLERIRDRIGKNARISIFSDAAEDELRTLLRFPNTQICRMQSDLAEMFGIANAELIVTSRHSTFGYWAAFLSRGSVIFHPTHERGSITGGKRFEGTVEQFLAQDPILTPQDTSAT